MAYRPMEPLDRVDKLIKLFAFRRKQERAAYKHDGLEGHMVYVRFAGRTIQDLKAFRRELGRDLGLIPLPKPPKPTGYLGLPFAPKR